MYTLFNKIIHTSAFFICIISRRNVEHSQVKIKQTRYWFPSFNKIATIHFATNMFTKINSEEFSFILSTQYKYSHPYIKPSV